VKAWQYRLLFVDAF